MKLVVDASIVVALVFPDERPQAMSAVSQCMEQAETIAPGLFWYEIRATAMKKERRRILSPGQVDEALGIIDSLSIRIVASAHDGQILTQARKHALTVYDASYLALAISEGAKLATLDAELARAARKDGVLLGA